MITVHHLNASRSLRVLWMLEELGLEYKVKYYFRDPKTQLAGDDLKAVHPLGKSPVIDDDGLVVAETGLILEYILEKHGQGKLCPKPGTPEHLKMRYLLHYTEGTLMSDIFMTGMARRIADSKAPFFIKPILKGVSAKLLAVFNPRLKNQLEFLSDELGDQDWIVNNQLSAADIMLSFALDITELGSVEIPENLKRYVERMHNRDAYKKALVVAKEDKDFLAMFR